MLKLLKCSLFVSLGLLTLAGCGGAAADPNLIPVTGSVTLDGRPIEGATVTFVGTGSTPGGGGTGQTDAEGKFEIEHFRAGKGLLPGEYKVVVNKITLRDGSPIPLGTVSAAELNVVDVLPRRYSDYEATTLRAIVQPGGNPHQFAITSR